MAISGWSSIVCGSINYDLKTANDRDELLTHLIKVAESYNKITNYYLIPHDETEVYHIHYIFVLNCSTRIETVFNKIADLIVYKYRDTRDIYGINIDACENFNSYMRYILHQDKESVKAGKKRYELEDIVSDDSYNSIKGIINSKHGKLDEYYLRDCVLDTTNDFELMTRLGLDNFHKYFREIMLLKEMIGVLRLHREEEKENLPF